METEKVFHIETATRTDLDVIMQIEALCFMSEAFSKRQMLHLIIKAKGVFYVLKYHNQIVAYLSLITNSYTKHARVYSIAVHPDTRGMQFGQSLLDKAMAYAKEYGCRLICLEVKTTNTAAIRLYEKNGFTQTGIRYRYYPDGSDAYCMAYPFR